MSPEGSARRLAGLLFGGVLASLKVPAGEDTVLVYVNVTSGTAAISGVFAQVDVTTRDGTTTDMSRADF